MPSTRAGSADLKTDDAATDSPYGLRPDRVRDVGQPSRKTWRTRLGQTWLKTWLKTCSQIRSPCLVPNYPTPPITVDTDLVGDEAVVSEDLATLRSYELDALSAILPPDRRDRLAEILTDDDVATLKHLAKQGMGRNSLRALASDLNYLETWAQAALGHPLPWPAPEALVLKFVAHHLYDARAKEADPSHGMPANVEQMLKADGCLRTDGPHAPATVRRRLALWSTLHRWRGMARGSSRR